MYRERWKNAVFSLKTGPRKKTTEATGISKSNLCFLVRLFFSVSCCDCVCMCLSVCQSLSECHILHEPANLVRWKFQISLEMIHSVEKRFHFPPKAGKYINGVVSQSVSQLVS